MTTASSELLTGAAYGLVAFVAVLGLAAALRVLGARGRTGGDAVVRPPAAGPVPVPGDALEAQVRGSAGGAAGEGRSRAEEVSEPVGGDSDRLRDFLPGDWTPLGPPSADPDGVRFPMARPDGSRVVVRMLPSADAGAPRATKAFLSSARDLRSAGLPFVVGVLAVETDPWPHVVEDEVGSLTALPDGVPPCPAALRLLARIAEHAASAASAGFPPLALAPWSVGYRGDGSLALRGLGPLGSEAPALRGDDMASLLVLLIGTPELPPPLRPPLLVLPDRVAAGEDSLAALAVRLREQAAALPCSSGGDAP